MRRLILTTLLGLCVTGCYTNVLAPGVTGRIIDSKTRQPVRNARIERATIVGGRSWPQGVYIPQEGLPTVSVIDKKSGYFDLPPALHTQIYFLVERNPDTIDGAFLVSADGYASQELQGTATKRTSWRVELGVIPLEKR